jgi:hypothetical protein
MGSADLLGCSVRWDRRVLSLWWLIGRLPSGQRHSTQPCRPWAVGRKHPRPSLERQVTLVPRAGPGGCSRRVEPGSRVGGTDRGGALGDHATPGLRVPGWPHHIPPGHDGRTPRLRHTRPPPEVSQLIHARHRVLHVFDPVPARSDLVAHPVSYQGGGPDPFNRGCSSRHTRSEVVMAPCHQRSASDLACLVGFAWNVIV